MNGNQRLGQAKLYIYFCVYSDLHINCGVRTSGLAFDEEIPGDSLSRVIQFKFSHIDATVIPVHSDGHGVVNVCLSDVHLRSHT